MDILTLKKAQRHTNEQVIQKATNSPTQIVSFDGGVYSLPNNVVNGQVSASVKGLTATNIVKNGNFEDTSNWTPIASSLSVSNNVLLITGSGTSAYPRAIGETSVNCETGKVVWVRGKIKITNSSCNELRFRIQGSDGGSQLNIANQVTPIENQLYVFNAKLTLTDQIGAMQIYIEHRYVDTGTANGAVAEVQEVFAIDMTAAGLDTLTADEMNAKFPHWFDGTKSTNSVRVKNIGANWFDGEFPFDGRLTSQGKLVPTSTEITTSYIRVLPNMQYTLKNFDGVKIYRICGYSDKNESSFSQLINDSNSLSEFTFMTGINTNYIRAGQITTNKSTKLIISLGATVSTYELGRKESSATIILSEPLRSLPNSVKDEVNVTTGLATRRIGVKTNVASGTVINYVDMATGGQFVAYAADGTQQVGAKGDTLTITAVTLTYQLAEPVVTKLTPQKLEVFEGGTVYIELVGDPAESTLPSVELTVPVGQGNQYGIATHDYQAAAADWVLSSNEAKCMLLKTTNAGAAVNIIAPDRPGVLYAVNNTSGQAVTIKKSGGTGVAIVTGKTALVMHNGTDYIKLTGEV